MALGGSRNVHVDAALSNFAIQYSQKDHFISDEVLKPMMVRKESDKYFLFAQKDIISIPRNILRASGTPAKEFPGSISTSTYTAEEYALADIVPDRDRENADQPIQLDMDTTQRLTENVLLEREKRVADAVFNTTTFTSYTAALTGGDRWDQFDTSDPFGDVETGKNSVLQNALRPANTVIMGYDVFKSVRNHPDLLDRIKYTGSEANPATLDEPEMAKAFGVDRVLVGRAVYNNANEGQTAVPAYAWGKFVMVAYVAPQPPRKGITLGTTFRARNFRVRRWRDDEREGDMIETSVLEDEKITVAGAGYLFSTVVS